MMTKTNKIGVVGSHPIPEIIRNINALTLGTNQSIQTLRLRLYGLIRGLTHQRIWMHKVLAEQGNDILFTTTDSPSVVTLAEKLDGVWSMGNDAPMGQFGPNSYITGMMFNWNLLYKHIVDQLAEGKLKMGQRWAWGLDKNCVGLSPWGKNVPGEVVNKVETVKMDWVNDKMGTYYPFDQGVTMQDGSKIKCGVIARPELETMQFFD